MSVAHPQAAPAGAMALPASLGQQRLWFLEQVEPGTGRYNLGVGLRVSHPLDVDALRRALDELAARHEPLRTVLTAVDGQAAQVIHPPAPVALAVDDVSTLPEGERAAAARRRLEAHARRPYDLARGPLFRPHLVRLGAAEHVLSLDLHHAAADEHSLNLLVREVQALYRAFAAGLPSPLGEPPVQYADFALWQREMLEAGEMDRQLAWWREQMRGTSGILDLPTDRPRPAAPSWTGASHEFPLPREVRGPLAELARQEGTTMFTALLALFQLLLGRMAGQDDVVVGTPVSGRTAETADTVGFFVNTLALRTDLGGNPTFRALLRRVRDTVMGGLAHPDLPLERLVEALPLERDASRPPLFQAMFVFGPDAPAGVDGAGWTRVPVDMRTARYDLTLVVRDSGQALRGVIDYATELFDPETAARIGDRLCTLAAAVAADPDAPVWDVPLLADDEARRVLAWSGQPANPVTAPVHRLVEAQAARTPDADAVVVGDGVLSYAELNARANRLARRLAALGIVPEERVAVVADRSAEAIVALLAVLKAGGAYVPIDPATPAARAAGMARDAGVRFAVGRPGHEDVIAGWGAAAVADGGAAESEADLPVTVDPGQLAYVIYTSGSTGTPKGVMVSHGGLAGLAVGFVGEHGFGPGERVLVVPPLSFDASAGDVYPALVSGAALVLHPAPGELGGAALLAFCRAHRVTMVDTAAALWGQWTDELASGPPADPGPLRMVMMGGEAAALERAAAWSAATGGRVELVNHYGPTEATVCATLQITRDAAEWRGRSASIPIGRAVAGARVYVLDGRGHPAGIGVHGELCIGGTGVARGYLGQPGLTAESFVPDPFDDRAGARMYRTGDRVRWLADGVLEFLGRADHQVKVRGYRVEPGEVESALLAHPAVRQALVMVDEGPPARRRLVAYVGSAAAPAAAELRGHLRGRLPEYMVPGAFVVLPQLPMTPHGKVDRRALPAPAAPADDDAYAAPRTETEQALAGLWARVLGVPRVGVDDDFFELGGHSLLALPLVHRVREALGVEVPLRTLFAAPTVAGMAAAVQAARAGGSPASALPPELRADLRLADGLWPDAPYQPGRPLRNVFLTGATGFLGAYLLHGLLRETSARVHCLVRAASAEEGRARIAANLARYLSCEDGWMDRVVPVPGDLDRPGLGVDEERFRALAGEADAIVHNGGVVNFTLPYGRMRGANVQGTAEVLRLACAVRATPVHFVSTLGVFLADETQDVRVDEETPPPAVEQVHDPYTQTKWVADALVRAVAARGVPVTIHRPARVGPDARTGAANADDFFSRILRGIARMGAAPDVEWRWDVAPVDQVAAAIVRGVADEAWLHGTYHYFNPRLLPFADLVQAVRDAAGPVVALPYAAWRERALAQAADPAHPLYPLLPLFPADPRGRERPRFHTPRTDALMAAAGAAWPDAGGGLVPRALGWFAARGELAPADAQPMQAP